MEVFHKKKRHFNIIGSIVELTFVTREHDDGSSMIRREKEDDLTRLTGEISSWLEVIRD